MVLLIDISWTVTLLRLPSWGNTHFLFEEILPVLERAQLDLPLFVLQLSVRELEIGDEVIEGLEHLLNRQRDQYPILNTQTIQVSGREETERGQKR